MINQTITKLLILIFPYAQLADALIGIFTLSLVRTTVSLNCAKAIAKSRNKSKKFAEQ